MPSIAFPCPSCRQRNKAKVELAGKRAVCTFCRTELTIPALPQGVTAPPAPVQPVAPIDGQIKFACSVCGRRDYVDAEKAGMIVACAGCGKKVKVPGERPAHLNATASPSKAPKPAAIDLFDFEAEPVESSAPVFHRIQAPEPATAEADKPKKKKRKKKGKKGGPAGLGGDEALGLLGAVVVVVLIVGGIGAGVPAMRAPLGMLLLIPGGLLAFIGNWSFSAAAREEGFIHVVMCRYVPFYKVYFLLSRWETMREHILFYGIGVTMLFTGLGLWSLDSDLRAAGERKLEAVEGKTGPPAVVVPSNPEADLD